MAPAHRHFLHELEARRQPRPVVPLAIRTTLNNATLHAEPISVATVPQYFLYDRSTELVRSTTRHTAAKPRSLADLGPPYCALFSTLLRAVLRPIALCSLPYCTLFSALLRSSLPGTLASAVDTGHPPLTFSLGPLEKKEEKEKACTLCCEGATGRQWGEIGTRRGRCARCAPPAPPACPTVSTWRRRGSQCR